MKQVTLPGTEQAVVANFNEVRWQDMLEEAANELLGGKGAGLDLIGGRFLVLEGDVAVSEGDEAAVAEGDAEDVKGPDT